MTEPTPDTPIAETDPRFPSGAWAGFFLQQEIPGRHLMELKLEFAEGTIRGEGRDWVGEFLVRGRYDTDDGQCWWHKRYLGAHDLYYRGFNEGKGIWGTWQMSEADAGLMCLTGGFHIWPEGMADPSQERLSELLDVPVVFEEEPELDRPLLTP